MLRLGLLRRFSTAAPARAAASVAAPASGAASQAPVGSVVLENLETRWPTLSNAEREAHRAKLLQVLKGDWKQLTHAQKKAAMFVAYGAPNAHKPASDLAQVVGGTVVLTAIGITIALTARATFGNEMPKTMKRDWQEASNEYAKKLGINPISGISSEGYKGKGFIQ